MKTLYLYILRCADGSYYTGVTNDLERRFTEYQTGLIPGCYTHDRRLVELMYSDGSTDFISVLATEKQINR